MIIKNLTPKQYEQMRLDDVTVTYDVLGTSSARRISGTPKQLLEVTRMIACSGGRNIRIALSNGETVI